MVVAGVDGGPVELLIAGDVEAVLVLGELGAHGAKIAGDKIDAVGLLNAQLFGVADRHAGAGVGGDGGEDGDLVDELRGEGAGDVEGLGEGSGIRIGVYLDRADELAVKLLDREDANLQAEGGDDVEEDGPGGVHAEGVEHQVALRKEEGGGEEEGGGGEVAGDGEFGDGVEVLGAGDAECFA